MSAHWLLADHQAPGWYAEVDALYALLSGEGAALVPIHFVKTTFVKMGGLLATLSEDERLLAIGLLFPRAIEAGRQLYTLRLHALAPLPPDEQLIATAAALVAPHQVVLHRHSTEHSLTASRRELAGFAIGAPSGAELAEVRRLYAAIWGVPGDEAYPDDLYSAAFLPGTSLVARRNDQLAGFLLGFYRFGLAALEGIGLPYRLDLGVESQVMGVAPGYRRFGLAATLKREQARELLARQLDLLHWTADPLQYPNAVLNFGKLRAVAGEFTRAYYPFQNELNRVPASRLGISWLPRSAHGRAGLADSPRPSAGLARFPSCGLLNDGARPLPVADDAPHLALHIPADWTALQREEPNLAAEWRALSDELLAARLGYYQGRYVIGDAASEGERRYLIAHRFTPALLAL